MGNPYNGRDINVLKSLAGKESVEAIAELLGRSPQAIRQFASKHKISLAPKNIRKWTWREKAFVTNAAKHRLGVTRTLCRLIPRHDREEIAELYYAERKKL